MFLLPLPMLHLLVSALVSVCCAATLRSKMSMAVWSFVCAVASAFIGLRILQAVTTVELNPYYLDVYTLQSMVYAFTAPFFAMLAHGMFTLGRRLSKN